MKYAILAAAAAALLSPVSGFAQDSQFDADLAALNLATVGRWTGELTFYDASGPVSTAKDGFTFAVTDGTGLDFAFWRGNQMNWEIYRGGGLYSAQIFNADGAVTERDFIYADLQAPQGPDGEWRYVLLPQGGDAEIRVSYSGRAGQMSFVAESRPRGSDAAFSRVSSGSYTMDGGD